MLERRIDACKRWREASSEFADIAMAQALRVLPGDLFASLTDRYGSGVPVRAMRKLTLTCEPREGCQRHRHERRRMAGSKVLRTYVAGNSQRQVDCGTTLRTPQQHKWRKWISR